MIRKRRRPQRFLPYLLLSPALVLLIGMIYPFGLGLYYSLTNYWLQYPKRFRFIWFDNYINLLDETLFPRALGFTIIGTVPDAYRHAREGLVDAHIMYKRLTDEP